MIHWRESLCAALAYPYVSPRSPAHLEPMLEAKIDLFLARGVEPHDLVVDELEQPVRVPLGHGPRERLGRLERDRHKRHAVTPEGFEHRVGLDVLQ